MQRDDQRCGFIFNCLIIFFGLETKDKSLSYQFFGCITYNKYVLFMIILRHFVGYCDTRFFGNSSDYAHHWILLIPGVYFELIPYHKP